MRVFGIVCECNPFHAGHRLILEKARENGADAVIAVMSGDFVQRGEPAMVSKFARAADLADGGADLVFELPVRYALSSAEGFAEGAVRLLDGTGIADTLFFGSECGDIRLISEAAGLVSDGRLTSETALLAEQGLSWPAARQRALVSMGHEKAAELLNSPNNILAVEYLKALESTGSSMKALTVKREDDGFTAHGVRERYIRGEDISSLVSERTMEELRRGGTPDREAWSRIALYRLRSMTRQQFAELEDVSGGLDSRIYAAAKTAASLEELYEAVKTKRYTMSRVKRVIARAVLDIKGREGEPGYLRLLAIGERGKELLSLMAGKSVLPVIAGLKSAEGEAEAAEEMRATDLYSLIKRNPTPAFEDYTGKLYVKT